MVSLKYARVERERPWLLASVPAGVEVFPWIDVTDRYLTGTRLRLRETLSNEGGIVRKLGQKIRLGEGPAEIACASVYLDDAEWATLSAMPGHELRKRRFRGSVGGVAICVDEFGDHIQGLVLAEVDGGAGPAPDLPAGLGPVVEVTTDEALTGAALAASSRAAVELVTIHHGIRLG